MNRHYTFVTTWHIKAPLEAVWEKILHFEKTNWWPGVRATLITRGDKDWIGAAVDSTWRSWLPYTLALKLTVTEATPGKHLQVRSEGDLQGTGSWQFSEANNSVTAVYTWSVSTRKKWMNFLAPIASPIFANAHHVLMKRGEKGLQKLLEKAS